MFTILLKNICSLFWVLFKFIYCFTFLLISKMLLFQSNSRYFEDIIPVKAKTISFVISLSVCLTTISSLLLDILQYILSMYQAIWLGHSSARMPHKSLLSQKTDFLGTVCSHLYQRQQNQLYGSNIQLFFLEVFFQGQHSE